MKLDLFSSLSAHIVFNFINKNLVTFNAERVELTNYDELDWVVHMGNFMQT